MLIVYNSDAGLVLVAPFLSSGLTLDEIIKRDIPDDIEYSIVDRDSIPDAPQETLTLKDGVIIVDEVALNTFHARLHESRRNELLAESAVVTADWRAEASIDEISDEDRVKLKAWLAYNKAVRATAVGEEWPPVPES